MTLYTNTAHYLVQLPALQTWPEMRHFLLNAVPHEPHDWQLPVLGSQAVGGDEAAAIPCVASIAALQASIILIDDMLDADPRGYHHQIGMPAAANLASALQAASLDAIHQAKLPPATKAIIMHSLGQMMWQTAHGQQLDIQNPTTEAAYWHVVATKSAPFFGTALYIGALSGGATATQAEQIQAFGNLYGEMIQIHDDLHDTMNTPAGPDWLLQRSPLPILFALTVPHPERDRFAELRQQAQDPKALRAAQEILVRCGAVSYSVDQIFHRFQRAQKLLQTLTVARPDKLEKMLAMILKPIQQLLQEVGGTELATAD